MQKFCFLLVLLSIGQFAQGQQLLAGVCRSPAYLNTFFPQDISGLWYQYASYPFILQLNQKCGTVTYSDVQNNKLNVAYSGISEITGDVRRAEAVATILGPGRWNVKMNGVPQGDEQNYVIIGTDYENYAVVNNCVNLFASRAEYVWVLTRDRVPNAETLENINNVLENNKISLEYLRLTDQDGCPPASA